MLTSSPGNRLLADRVLWLGAALVSAAGVAVTGYLTYVHVIGGEVACIGGGGCQEVQASRYASIFGLPIVYLGLAFYLTSLLLGLGGALDLRGWRRWSVPALFVLTLAGAIFSLYLTGLQYFVLHSFCGWCLTSAVLAMSLLVLALVLLWRW